MNLQRVMWKYPLMPGTATYDMPYGAEIKSCGYVAGDVVVWALVAPPVDVTAKGAMDERRLTCAMTGEMLDLDALKLGRFIGTVVRPDGIVVHIYENF